METGRRAPEFGITIARVAALDLVVRHVEPALFEARANRPGRPDPGSTSAEDARDHLSRDASEVGPSRRPITTSAR